MRAMVTRGVLEEDPARPGEPKQRFAAYDYAGGHAFPEWARLQVIADILRRPISYFVDETYHERLAEAVAEGLTEVLLRVVREESGLIEAAEQVTGRPNLFSPARQRLARGTEQDLVRFLQSRAPEAWAALPVDQQRQLVRALLREELADWLAKLDE